MDLDLENKIVIISGAAGKKGSIGETIVQYVANERAIPVLVDRNDRGYDYAQKLRSQDIDSLFVKADLTSPDDIEHAIDRVIEKYGRIDVLINNVGVNDSLDLESSYEEFMDSLKLNLVSYFLMTKFTLPWLKISKGNILNIGSKVAITGQGGTSGYAAAKGGVLALTREWAVDLLKYNIRVNCLIVAESWTPAYESWIKAQSDYQLRLQAIKQKIPLENRMTTPEEIANMALVLISGKSSHTTGQHIFIDGGYVHLDRVLVGSAIKENNVKN
ncbi:SDR family oxidoreductase [Fulvivirgaceae bacterium BMA10]|uniref:SDR family oxidoreductase n=1 Tax=Splendidivirga corallicola TaxID=3051826 RepID=A0ABT8KQ15_9BACT|nr:SDR family oxidoreductase [Fulvivirgaceae bacterium BMA10]